MAIKEEIINVKSNDEMFGLILSLDLNQNYQLVLRDKENKIIKTILIRRIK